MAPHTHRSRVRYIRHLNPFAALVDWVKYGGRQPDNGSCYHLEYWKHQKTEWDEWNGSSWVTEESEGEGNWMSSPSDHSISYPHTHHQNVLLNTGGRVNNQLKYKETHLCWPRTDFVYTGRVSRHYLE